MKDPILPLRLWLPILVLAFAALGIAAIWSSAGAQDYLEAVPIQLEKAHGGDSGPIEGPAAQAILYGPLSIDPADLARRKALAAQKFGIAPLPEAAKPVLGSLTAVPPVLLGKKGVFDMTSAPLSDSTGAIGTKRYVELVNSKIGIYDSTLNLIKQDTLDNLFDTAGTYDFSVQIIWDAATRRFYYAGNAVFSTSDNEIAVGFSKTASPSNATIDWCHYELPFGSDFPDFPHLGDSAAFIVIGANIFTSDSVSGTYLGSDIVAISKPPAGTTCPSTLKSAMAQNISIGGVPFGSPVPANEIDAEATATIVTVQLPSNVPRTEIGLFSVNADSSGNPVFPAGSILTVNPYDTPPNAPQRGTPFLLETLDAQITQAVGAMDPLRGKFAVWTQHTIAGGAGSEVRWYEIDPVGKTLLQTGDVTSQSRFFFNAAISPDRVVKGATKAFGSNMLLNFNASSSTTLESIRMVRKRGTKAVSLPTVVKRSTGPDTDFSCPLVGGVCRWGEYGGASPDPNSPTAARAGIVWGTSTWTKPGSSDGTPSWRTWNWKSHD